MCIAIQWGSFIYYTVCTYIHMKYYVKGIISSLDPFICMYVITRYWVGRQACAQLELGGSVIAVGVV